MMINEANRIFCQSVSPFRWVQVSHSAPLHVRTQSAPYQIAPKCHPNIRQRVGERESEITFHSRIFSSQTNELFLRDFINFSHNFTHPRYDILTLLPNRILISLASLFPTTAAFMFVCFASVCLSKCVCVKTLTCIDLSPPICSIHTHEDVIMITGRVDLKCVWAHPDTFRICLKFWSSHFVLRMARARSSL